MAWSSIDPRPGSRPGSAAVGALLAVVCLAGACTAQEAPPDAPQGAAGVELIRHGPGGASAAELSGACRERLPSLAAELLAGASPVRLLVTEDRIGEVKDAGALEIVFDETRRFGTAADADTRARRLLLPLSDPSYVGSDESPYVTVFRGEEGYGSGPYRNPDGLELLRELEACAGGS